MAKRWSVQTLTWDRAAKAPIRLSAWLRLGAQAHFAGIIGADKLGEIATDLYAREGVDRTWLQRTKAMATGVGFIILNAEGENGIILDMGANELMDSAYVDQVEAQIARSDVVMSVLEIPVAAAARAMELGKKHGVRTILNPAPAVALDGRVLQDVDYLTPNETELRILLGLAPDDPTDSVELARQLRARGVGNLIVTMGEKGALILTEDGQEGWRALRSMLSTQPAQGTLSMPVWRSRWLKGKSLAEAVAFANRCGALACQKLGVVPALATRAMVGW